LPRIAHEAQFENFYKQKIKIMLRDKLTSLLAGRIIDAIKETGKKKYYYHLVDEAKKAHILVQGKDGYGQQGLFLNSPEQRKRILAYEEQQRQLSLSFVNDSENQEFPTTENPEPAPY
jgi:hypothetical protein